MNNINNMYQLAVTTLLLAALNCAYAEQYEMCKRNPKDSVAVGNQWIDIVSENWPGKYNDRRRCGIQLKAINKGAQLMIHIVEISTEKSYDGLRIWGAGKQLALCTQKRCWNNGKPVVTSLNNWLVSPINMMYLQWWANQNNNLPRGFHVRVKQVPNPRDPCKMVVGKPVSPIYGKVVREGLEKHECKAHCLNQRQNNSKIRGMTYDMATGYCACVPYVTFVPAFPKTMRTCKDMNVLAP
jgi:hypothetical protein